MVLALLVTVCLGSNLPPRFMSDPNGPGSEIVVIVKEGPESLGKEILRVAGEDPDGDDLTFGVQASAGSELIRIVNHVPSRNSAVIYLNKELDRETKDSYSLVLTLTDGKLGTDKFVSILFSSFCSFSPSPYFPYLIPSDIRPEWTNDQQGSQCHAGDATLCPAATAVSFSAVCWLGCDRQNRVLILSHSVPSLDSLRLFLRIIFLKA